MKCLHSGLKHRHETHLPPTGETRSLLHRRAHSNRPQCEAHRLCVSSRSEGQTVDGGDTHDERVTQIVEVEKGSVLRTLPGVRLDVDVTVEVE